MKIIYGLHKENDFEIRYIGQTSNLKSRLSQHRCLSSREGKIKKQWIKNLKENNLKVECIVLEEVKDSEADFWERYYISLFKSWGYNILNNQDGGRKGFHLSENQKKDITEHFKQWSNENGPSFKGNHSEKSKEKMSLSKIKCSILQYDLRGQFVREWNCGYKTIAEKLNIDGSGILDVLNKRARKCFDSLWFYKDEFNEEELQKSLEQLKCIRRKKHSHEICQYDLNGNLIKVWIFKELKKAYKQTTRINYCLNGRVKSAYNSLWKYKDENDL